MCFVKTLVIAAMLSVLGITAAGCSSRSPLTAEEFMEAVNALDYTTEELSGYGDESPIRRGIAGEADGVRIEFYQCADSENAVVFYQWNREQLEEKKERSSTASAFGAGNYQRYTLKTSNTYYYIAQLGETVVYASGSKQSDDIISKHMKELGY